MITKRIGSECRWWFWPHFEQSACVWSRPTATTTTTTTHAHTLRPNSSSWAQARPAFALTLTCCLGLKIESSQAAKSNKLLPIALSLSLSLYLEKYWAIERGSSKSKATCWSFSNLLLARLLGQVIAPPCNASRYHQQSVLFCSVAQQQVVVLFCLFESR